MIDLHKIMVLALSLDLKSIVSSGIFPMSDG